MKERTKARAWALRVLYAWDSRRGATLDDILEELLSGRRVAAARRPYLRQLVEAVACDPVALDRTIQECLSNWRLERLAVIDRNILRLAAAEMLHIDDVPARVSIQEALRLAERYGTDQSPRFVNGVLDALMKRLERE